MYCMNEEEKVELINEEHKRRLLEIKKLEERHKKEAELIGFLFGKEKKEKYKEFIEWLNN